LCRNYLDRVYAYEIDMCCVYGGFEMFLYQLSLGCSIRYMYCLRSVMLRFYIGPFKLWLNFPNRIKDEKSIPNDN